MNYYYSGFPYSDELYHHGIKNQKWGERRYQNEDGSLTALGRIHYGVGKARDAVVKAYKRKHPGLMNDDELTAEINRQKKLNELKKAREEYGKGSAGEKIKEIMWSGAKTAVTTVASQTMTKIGQELGSRIIETNQQKQLREITEKANIQEQTKNLYDKTKEAIKKYNELKEYNESQKQEAEDAKKAKREEAELLKRKKRDDAALAKQREEEYKAKAESARAEAEYIMRQGKRKREEAAQQAAQRREEANRKAVQARERKAKEIVENIFKNERIRNAEYKDSMAAMRKKAEYNAAKRRALKLAEEGSKITVADLFFDGHIDG